MSKGSVIGNILAKSKELEKKCPSDVIGNKIERFTDHLSDTKGIPTDFLLTSILAVLATSIGNTHTLRTLNGYTARSIVFAVIVAPRGSNKSQAIREALKPIRKLVSKLHEQYKAKLQEFKAFPDESAERPIFTKPLINDATPEAVIQNLNNYDRGSLLAMDELAGHLKMDKYGKGSEEELWLSLHGGDSILVDRKNADAVFVPTPNISVIGGIQIGVAEKQFSDRVENGSADRYLFCAPENTVKPYPTTSGVDPVIASSYESIVDALLAFEYSGEPIELNYCSSSWDIVYKRICESTDRQNNPNVSETERGILAKFDIYIHRFCLIIQLARFASGETTDKTTIDVTSATNAVRLMNYFFHQVERFRIKDRSETLTGLWKDVYDMLPDHGMEFTTGEFLLRTEMMEIKERTAKSWLKDNSSTFGDKLLVKIKHGTYTKS